MAWVNGRTRLVEHRQIAPLKIARTFESDDGGMEICIMDASPGLLAGDCYEFEWILERGARARITTQGATRVHPSPHSPSSQKVRIAVAEGAHLEMWPETIIPFRGARFDSHLEATLEEGGNLLLFENLSAGRIARDEIFAFESVMTKLHVRDGSGPRLFSRNRFIPAEFAQSGAFNWGRATQWSNLFAFGPDWYFDPSRVQVGLANAQQVLEERGLWGAATTLARGDFAVSMLGNRAYDLRAAALQIVQDWKKDEAVSRETP